MKKFLILSCFIFIGFGLQAQTITKKDAKKVSREINDNIKKVEVLIETSDWSELQNILDKTLTIIEKNTDAIIEIVEDIDVKEVVKTMEKVGQKIEDNIDADKIEKAADKISKKVEDALESKTTTK